MTDPTREAFKAQRKTTPELPTMPVVAFAFLGPWKECRKLDWRPRNKRWEPLVREADAKARIEAEIEARRADAERPALTSRQRTDLLAAALYISARDDDSAVLKSEDAERIVELLGDLSGIDLDAIDAAREVTGETRK
jgi:hypothetical protein